MKISNLIKQLEVYIEDSSKGLPEDIFLFSTRIVPMINVDLLIQNDHSQTLLTWREDKFCGSGWHIPGGIIRYKEKIFDRIKEVAGSELGATVAVDGGLLAIQEMINPIRKNRGHFISLLYKCRLTSPLNREIQYENEGVSNSGEWAWHDQCPDNIVSVHEVYRRFIGKNTYNGI